MVREDVPRPGASRASQGTFEGSPSGLGTGGGDGLEDACAGLLQVTRCS